MKAACCFVRGVCACQVDPEGGGFGGEEDWLGGRVAGGEDLGVLGPDGEGVGAGWRQGEVGEEDEEALLLARSDPPVARGRDGEISGVVGRLENREAWAGPMNTVGCLAPSRGGGALGVGGGVDRARPARSLTPLRLVRRGGAGKATPGWARVVGTRQARVCNRKKGLTPFLITREKLAMMKWR